MPFTPKDFLFFLGILWVMILSPRTTAYPTPGHSSEHPFIIYPMKPKPNYRKENLTCNYSLRESKSKKGRVFTCFDNYDAAVVTVPLLSKRCKSRAKKLTITVNRDDDVIIEFQRNVADLQMKWSKASRRDFKEISVTDKSKLILPSDKTMQSGVYLFQVDDGLPEGSSEECAVMLIRRECPANRYGEQCSDWCPDCMHGGVCDAKTGKCFCPPGTKGEFCEEACEDDRILNSCTNVPAITHNIQICLPSPYGCSCPPGKKDYMCKEECENGRWGVDCLQTCNRCGDGTCNAETGKCSTGQENPCAGDPKGYYRFREEPEVQPDERQATVHFSKVFDGEKPDSKNITYQVVIWEKDQSMGNITTSAEVTDDETSVTIAGLAPATNYYAAVLVKFTLNDRVCKIDGTLRGERIQKKMFATKCPKGEISSITLDGISEKGFNISWKEEVHARYCNYSYDVKVIRASDEEVEYDDIVEKPSHIQESLERYTEYKVTVAVVSGEVKSDLAATTIKTLPRLPTTPPFLEKNEGENADLVTYKWNRPWGVEGDIFYKYTYKVKPLACDQETESQPEICTQDTEASFLNPPPYANVTFMVAIGNEAGFSEYSKSSHITSSKVPEIKVEEIYCDDHIPPKQCSVSLEDDCQKINGKDLNIHSELVYITNSARNPRGGNRSVKYFRPQSIHENFTIVLPDDLYHHTTYQLTVVVKNDAGTNESSRFFSEKIITPPVAPGKVNITRISSSHSSIELAWDPPPPFPPTGDIREYVINVSKTKEKPLVKTLNTTEETCSIHNLEPNVSYTIHVFGINAGVEEPGETEEIEIATVAQKPSQPIDVEQNSSLTEIVITWNDHQEDAEFDLRYELTLQNETFKISQKKHKFTGLQPEYTYPLQVKSCNNWKCSDVLEISISTNPQPPQIEGSAEVLDYSGNVSRIHLPRVKNPPAVQYVVVVEAIESLKDIQIKEKALQKVKEYIKEQENYNNHKKFKRSTNEEVKVIWVAGRFPIENVTTKAIDIGTGVGEDRAFQPEKDYKLVVITEKKSGHNREFSVSEPVFTKRKAVASGLAGILFGVLIFLVLIGLFAWTYKKQQAKNVVRASNQDRDCSLPAKEGTLQKKSPLLRKSPLNLDLVQEFPESPCIADEEIYSNLSRRINFADVESYLLKAIHSSETNLEFNSVPKVSGKSCSHSEHPENRLKNRYKNNLPYNDTRVRLPRLPQMPFSDYINANYIEGHLHPRAYIATQGPKDFNKDTTSDFWRMIWHTKSELIIMIANVVENGKVKVAQYWPSEGTMTKGGIDIKLESTEIKMDFIIRTFTANSKEETRKIQQYQFTTWPDHGVPENPYGVAHMINSIRSEPLTGPIVVHCSAGIGRTGTILLVLGVMDQINTSGYMDVHEVLVKLRNGRPRLIESTTQYKFAHQVLREILCQKQTQFTCQEFPEALLELRIPQTNTNMSSIQQQFHELKQLPKDLTYTFAQRPEVSHLNRDPEIMPPDSRLIYLQYTSGRDESQYINAVSVQSINGQVIVAEHPLRHTISRMWQMVYEKRISVWTLIHSFPPGDNDYPSVLPAECEENFDEFNVRIINHEDYDNFTEYHVTIRIMNSANSAPFHCMIVFMKGWPHTNPRPSSLLSLLAVMERADSLMTTSSAALFTCKDGITGCGLMMALKQTIDKVKLHQEVDIYHSVQLITYDRPEFIVSEEQYDLVHEGVALYLSAYSNYGNFN